MSQATGITKQEAIKATQTIIESAGITKQEAIIESAHVLLGYHNTFAFDTVCRKLRLLKEDGKDIDNLLGGDIVELIGEGCDITEKEKKDQLENHKKQIKSFIDIRSNVVEIIDMAEDIQKLQEKVVEIIDRAEYIQKLQKEVDYLEPDQ
jgi:Fe-S-cluster formation regulator IscX/YfhJ